MKGMEGSTAAVNELLGGSAYCTSAPAIPMPSPTKKATGRLRSLAAMTADKAATMSSVKSPESSPMIGAERTPVNPASPTLTAHTHMDTRCGLVPEIDVMAGESTMARTHRPTSV